MSIRPDTQIHKSKMPKISDPQDDHQLIQARAGERVLTQSQNKTYEASHPNARSLPRVAGTYDSGGVVPEDQIAQLSAGEKVLDPQDAAQYRLNNLDGSARGTEPAPAPAEQKMIADVHKQADDLQDNGIKTNNLAQIGLGKVYHNLAEQRTPSPMPKVEGWNYKHGGYESPAPEPTAPALGSIGESSAAPNLIQTKPEMPAYIGQKRIGKGTAGEAELKDERETKIDHLKYAIANGTREESANAQEQLARYEQGTPWGSPSNHAGILGKIGHIAARIGEGALDAYAGPEATATLIPGSKEGLAAKEVQGIGKIKELGEEKLQSAETGLKTAQTQEALKPKEPKELAPEESLMEAHKELRAATTPDAKAAAQQKIDDIVNAHRDYASAGQKPEKAEKLDDKKDFVNQFLKDNKLPDTVANRTKGLAAYAKANQAPERPQQTLMSVPDGNGGQKIIAAKPGMTISSEATKLGAGAAHFSDPVEALNPVTNKYEVMERGQVPKGAFAYKIDPTLVNSNAARMDDVQNKVNNLAEVVNSADMKDVNQALVGAALDKGTQVGFEGMHLDTGRLDAVLSAEMMKNMNEPTRNFIVALLGAHEAVTNLPALQTFGKSNRFNEAQMQASQKMLPSAGDDTDMSRKKMIAFQGILDPLRKRIVTLPNQPLMPAFTEGMHKEESAPKTTSGFAAWKSQKKE